ncbi:MAG TPA: hypothetical protein VF671_05205 [Pseudomonas sp.]|jgi:hypothetical protein|uniref:hypothetical protein n=1 Tax=Pseudomonas sp. TaxID=306 RepID=UPI002EDB85D6
MALYFLEYDLRKQRNYKPLYDELARFNAVRILESLWCFNRVNTNAVGLRDYFSTLIDSDDGVMVSEVSDWACSKAMGMPSQLK